MTSSYRPTGVELGAAIRRLIHREAGVPAQDRKKARDQHMVVLVRNRYPEVATFGKAPILALLRRLGPGTCSWCAASLEALALEESPPDPASPILRGLLGQPCSLHHKPRVASANARGPVKTSGDHRGWNSQDPLLWKAVLVHQRLTAGAVPTPKYVTRRRRPWPGEAAPRSSRRTVVPRGRP